MMLILIIALCLAYFIYQKGRENEDFFSTWKIKYSTPSFIFGHVYKLIVKRQDMFTFIQNLYNEFPDVKASGLWDMRTPRVLVRDLDLVKKLTVKDFDSFMDHKAILEADADEWLTSILVSMTGSKWREMRVTLSPAFTGSKMRAMFQLVVQVSQQLTEYLKEECLKSGNVLEYDIKDVCSKYTNDVIALCAFGMKVDTLKDPENDFYKTGADVMRPGFWAITRILAYRFFPKIAKALKIRLITDATRSFFSSMVLGSMQHRQEKNIKRPDMIHLLIEAKKAGQSGDTEPGSKRQWTDDELVAQCFMFFLAGFETSSTAMAGALYELVANPDVQQKLFEEVREKQDELDGVQMGISYEEIRDLKYLDMVVSEALRKWPPAAVTDRVCTKDLEYTDEDLELHFKIGDNLWIPIYAFHRDPRYFPEPERFYPERFSEDNRETMAHADAYMPFGLGPRSCIANRFALMEVKTLIYFVVLNFELVATQKTNLPVKITNIMGAMSKDIFFGFKVRG